LSIRALTATATATTTRNPDIEASQAVASLLWIQCPSEREHHAQHRRGAVAMTQDTRRSSRTRLLFAFLSLTVVLIGMLFMPAGMLEDQDTGEHAHAMDSALPSNHPGDRAGAEVTAMVDSRPGDAPPTCVGMCDDGCLMTGIPCATGPIALNTGPAAQIHVLTPLQSAVPRPGPALARSVPVARPPSLTALSINRV
jgi:hypothetical protein